MGPVNTWSTEEKLRLLASIDYCHLKGLHFPRSLPRMLAHQGVDRNWSGISAFMYRLGDKGSGPSAFISLQKQGSGAVTLSDADRARVATLFHEAAASAVTLNRNLTASSSDTALDSNSYDNASEGSFSCIESAKVCVFDDMSPDMNGP
jgi:hypothetical protein